MKAQSHDYQQLIDMFAACFYESENTRLVAGKDEPYYLPAGQSLAPTDTVKSYHQLVFAHGFLLPLCMRLPIGASPVASAASCLTTATGMRPMVVMPSSRVSLSRWSVNLRRWSGYLPMPLAFHFRLAWIIYLALKLTGPLLPRW